VVILLVIVLVLVNCKKFIIGDRKLPVKLPVTRTAFVIESTVG